MVEDLDVVQEIDAPSRESHARAPEPVREPAPTGGETARLGFLIAFSDRGRVFHNVPPLDPVTPWEHPTVMRERPVEAPDFDELGQELWRVQVSVALGLTAEKYYSPEPSPWSHIDEVSRWRVRFLSYGSDLQIIVELARGGGAIAFLLGLEMAVRRWWNIPTQIRADRARLEAEAERAIVETVELQLRRVELERVRKKLEILGRDRAEEVLGTGERPEPGLLPVRAEVAPLDELIEEARASAHPPEIGKSGAGSRPVETRPIHA